MKKIFLLLLYTLCLSCDSESQVLKGTKQFVNEDQVPGLILNWDLDDSGVVNHSGGVLIQLTDKGSGGYNVIPATSGVRPNYFATGGPNNKGYVEVTSGKSFANTSFSVPSPLTIYMVVKLPSLATTNGQTIFSFGATGGTDGIEYNTTSGGFFRAYTGVTPFFSSNHPLPNRTSWQLLKFTIKDANSFWLDVNNEPPGLRLNDTYGGALTVVDRLNLGTYPGIKIASVRAYNRILTDSEDQGIKTSTIAKYALQSPAKLVVLLGDSHTEGITSGTATLGPYASRLIANYPGEVINHGKVSACVDPGSYTQGYDFAKGVFNNLKDRVPLYNPAIYANTYVVFQYGTNDSAIRGTGAPGVPNRAAWNVLYKSYIQSFIDNGFPLSHLIICTPPYSTGTYVSTTLAEFNTDVKAIATEKGIVICNFYDAMISAGLDCNTTPDHIHGDDAIHTLLYNTLNAILHP